MQASIDTKWQQEQQDTAAERKEFPAVPGDLRNIKSVNEFIKQASLPHLQRLACAVCGELHWHWHIHIYSLTNNEIDRETAAGEEWQVKTMSANMRKAIRELLVDKSGLPRTEIELGLSVRPEEVLDLTGLAIAPDGVDALHLRMNICRHCDRRLRVHRMPAMGLANKLLVGRIPEQLKGLTWAEERVIALLRVSSMSIVHLRGSDKVRMSVGCEYGSLTLPCRACR